jgi:hypothetical protein
MNTLVINFHELHIKTSSLPDSYSWKIGIVHEFDEAMKLLEIKHDEQKVHWELEKIPGVPHSGCYRARARARARYQKKYRYPYWDAVLVYIDGENGGAQSRIAEAIGLATIASISGAALVQINVCKEKADGFYQGTMSHSNLEWLYEEDDTYSDRIVLNGKEILIDNLLIRTKGNSRLGIDLKEALIALILKSEGYCRYQTKDKDGSIWAEPHHEVPTCIKRKLGDKKLPRALVKDVCKNYHWLLR